MTAGALWCSLVRKRGALVDESGEQRKASAAARRKRGAIAGFRALIVDDDPAIVEMFRDVLGHDFAMTVCGTLAEGMAHAADPGLDVAIVDYRLPDGEGLDLLKHLASVSPAVPVIFATGFGNFRTASAAIESGARSLLEKPFTAGQLSAAVYRAVGERPAAGPLAGLARDEKLDALLALLREKLFEGIREKEVVEKLGVSRAAFQRYFKEHFGVSFREYVAKERLRVAKYLLATTALPVSEIASRVGVDDLAHFSAWFGEQAGVGALAYRKQASV